MIYLTVNNGTIIWNIYNEPTEWGQSGSYAEEKYIVSWWNTFARYYDVNNLFIGVYLKVN